MEANLIIHEQLSEAIIGACIEVHSQLGPGVLESAYEACLAREFELRNIPFRRQVALPIEYKGLQLECGYRLDFIIDESIVLEIKAIEKTPPIHEAQLLTYLRLTGLRVGLLVDFNSQVIRNSFIRRVL